MHATPKWKQKKSEKVARKTDARYTEVFSLPAGPAQLVQRELNDNKRERQQGKLKKNGIAVMMTKAKVKKRTWSRTLKNWQLPFNSIHGLKNTLKSARTKCWSLNWMAYLWDNKTKAKSDKRKANVRMRESLSFGTGNAVLLSYLPNYKYWSCLGRSVEAT